MPWHLYEFSKHERDNDGRRLKPNDWISIGDVGREYDGKTLTTEEYVRVEDQYVKTINNFMDCLGIDELSVRNLEMPHYKEHFALFGTGIPENDITLKEGAKLSDNILNNWVRLCLRDIVWSYLIKPNEFFVYFSQDFNVHIGSAVPLIEEKWQELLEPDLTGLNLTAWLTDTDIYDDVIALCTVN